MLSLEVDGMTAYRLGEEMASGRRQLFREVPASACEAPEVGQ